MKYEVFQNLIKETFSTLLPTFKCIPTRELPYFERTIGNTIQYITPYAESYRPGYELQAIICRIRFCKVEDIIEPLLLKYDLPMVGFKPATVYTISPLVKGNNTNDNCLLRVAENRDIENVIPILNQHLQQEVWPFFERFNSLEAVNNHIESLPINQLAKFIAGDVALKRLVIKRLCHNEDWIAYGNMVLDFFKEHSVKEPQHYNNLDKATLELMEVLINL